MHISRFTRPGAGNDYADTLELSDPSLELQDFLDKQAADKNEPTYWSFGSWDASATKQDHISSSAIVLEYEKLADHQAVIDAITDLGLSCYFLETLNGGAYILPLVEEVQFGRYTRMVAVLAELIGQQGLISGSGSATHLIKPKKGVSIHHLTGPAIPSDFHVQTTHLSQPISTWAGGVAIMNSGLATMQISAAPLTIASAPLANILASEAAEIAAKIQALSEGLAVLNDKLDAMQGKLRRL